MTSSTLNCGFSPFHCTLSLFCRSRDGRLLNAEGKEAGVVARHWPVIFERLKISKTTFTSLPSGLLVETTCFDTISDLPGPSSSQGNNRLCVREVYRDTSKCYVGHLSYWSQNKCGRAFFEWIVTFFILKTTLRPQLNRRVSVFAPRRVCDSIMERWAKFLFVSDTTLRTLPDLESKLSIRRNREVVTEKITVLFEHLLRNTAVSDEWNSSGRNYFSRRVRDFVNRNEPCNMVLPAFPCKSPCDAKVGGSRPDMAERIALETLHDFIESIEKIYIPGATILIIHDGHLLSSCIGVDDDVVSEYESDLKDLYRSMFTSSANRQAIRFCGLNDLFFSEPDSMQAFDYSWILDPELVHDPIPIKVSETAELSRKLVMASCGINRQHLRKLILGQDPATLKSYRGLSRFMLQDLEGSVFAGQSTSRKKKTAFIIAAEMMARNQAYSNLLELLFPNYIRLSIHAHNNHGPKFGIRLFPRHRVRVIDDIDGRYERVPMCDFQVPTPWHSSIVKVEGDEICYLTKASVARQAIANGRYTGGWVDDVDKGGYFLLQEVGLVLPAKVDMGKVDTLRLFDFKKLTT
ncbi:Pyoverdine/dityrosine biosynthesis protein-domain-containing protein [Xylaria digitata]|nr:Pyoverdine/dityrosine biosynthesis protein-domain-containing protein [Xylaria digitata]